MEAVLAPVYSLAEDALRLPPPSPRLTLSVVIPVRNEAAGIERTLASLARQVDLAGRPLDPDIYEVLLLANNCTDGTAEAARRFARRTPCFSLHVAEVCLPPQAAHVGTARRFLMDAACRRVMQDGRSSGVIASTDGDTEAAPDWAAQTLGEVERGADAVGGRIRVERGESRQAEDRDARLYALRDRAYQRGLARLEHEIDPDPADPWPRHHQFFGGSLAVTALAYRAAGGLPPLPCLEDVALGEALRRIDARIRHSPAVRVATSPRQQGRTPLGLSSQLREWGQMSRAGESHWVQQPAAVALRFAARRALRGLWQARAGQGGPEDVSAAAAALAVPAAVLCEGLAGSRQPFGALWAVVMEHHKQPGGVWARRWPLVPITHALSDLRRLAAHLR